MRLATVLLVALAVVGCGEAAGVDAGMDAGLDAGADAGRPDAGRPDAGPVDAGPGVDAGPPPRFVFGSMAVNGTTYELGDGFGTTAGRSHQLRLATPLGALPRVLVVLVLPSDAGAGFSAACGDAMNPFFSAQYSQDAGVAFFNLNPTCQVGLTQVAAEVGQEYRGTFAGTLGFEPRSVYDAGFPTLSITNGSFRVIRSF